MIERENIVVGGGPAGAAAAWQFRRMGKQCLVLDRETFPREKLCAGWITPEVLKDLAFSAADYPHRFLTFDRLNIGLWGMRFKLHATQHSIRRYEFDAWLLERSGAEVKTHNVARVTQQDDEYVIDGQYRCRNLVGAGGTRCPVYRELFRPIRPRNKALQTVALELEYPFSWHDKDCHLWFLTDRLPGYSWYVPKAEGYLNIGVGGIASKLNDRGETIKHHWEQLIERLLHKGLIDQAPKQPHGYSYYLREPKQVAQLGRACIVGDALGLATRDLCEGIGPAVRSGIAAALALSDDQIFNPDPISSFTSSIALIQRGLEWCYLNSLQSQSQVTL